MAVSRATDKAQTTRATLLDVAADTFEQDGYGATSVRDLEEYGRRRYGHARLSDWLARNFRDYRHRRAMRALLVEGAAAARMDEHARQLLREVLAAKQTEWAASYREIWASEGLDPEVDPAVFMELLWAAELGFGVMEAYGIEPPKPNVLSRAVGRIVSSLGSGGPAPH